MVKALSRELGEMPVIGDFGAESQAAESREMRQKLQETIKSVASNVSSIISALSPVDYKKRPSQDSPLESDLQMSPLSENSKKQDGKNANMPR